MANLDLASVWSTVKATTAAAQGGVLNQSSLVDIAKDIVAGALSGAKSGAAQGSGIDYIGIAKQLISLYEKFKGSSDTTEKATAINVKSISDIIGAMGGDKDSIISAGASAIGKALGGGQGGDSDSLVGKVLGGLFGK